MKIKNFMVNINNILEEKMLKLTSIFKIFLLVILIFATSNLFAATAIKDKSKKDKSNSNALQTHNVTQVLDNQQNTVSNFQFYNSNYGIFGFDIADGGGQISLVRLEEISELPKKGVDFFTAETARQVFDAAGGLVQLGKHHVHVGHVGAFERRPVLGAFAGGRAKIQRHVVLAHQPHEFDGGLAIEPDFGVAVQIHIDAHDAIGQLNVLHRADAHASHFDLVADLEFLGVVEEGADVVAAFEKVKTAERFQNNQECNHRKGEENAQFCLK